MASQLESVQAFADAALSVASLSDLDLMMREAAATFGADYYLMIHHANYFVGLPGLINLGNYPREFREISRQDGHDLADPIMEACERTLTGFFWSDVGSVIDLTPRHLERAAQVRETGLGDGFVVPAHVPGEHLGSCHFAVGSGKILPREYSAALQTIATFGFEMARRLVRSEADMQTFYAPLTTRQLDCLLLAARGKSDTVIGQLLGISSVTVNEHIEEAKRRYAVASRQQAIILALYSSQLTFAEILCCR